MFSGSTKREIKSKMDPCLPPGNALPTAESRGSVYMPHYTRRISVFTFLQYLEFFFSFFFFWSFCLFCGRSCGIWRFPGQGSNGTCRCRPTPEPEQHGIQAESATYTTAHGNIRSLTHRARRGIEPATSWFLVRLVNH